MTRMRLAVAVGAAAKTPIEILAAQQPVRYHRWIEDFFEEASLLCAQTWQQGKATQSRENKATVSFLGRPYSRSKRSIWQLQRKNVTARGLSAIFQDLWSPADHCELHCTDGGE